MWHFVQARNQPVRSRSSLWHRVLGSVVWLSTKSFSWLRLFLKKFLSSTVIRLSVTTLIARSRCSRESVRNGALPSGTKISQSGNHVDQDRWTVIEHSKVWKFKSTEYYYHHYYYYYYYYYHYSTTTTTTQGWALRIVRLPRTTESTCWTTELPTPLVLQDK